MPTIKYMVARILPELQRCLDDFGDSKLAYHNQMVFAYVNGTTGEVEVEFVNNLRDMFALMGIAAGRAHRIGIHFDIHKKRIGIMAGPGIQHLVYSELKDRVALPEGFVLEII